MIRSPLKRHLDRLVETYDRRFLPTDPLAFVHRYRDPEDQEVVGMVASSLAYGNVRAIRSSVEAVLAALGPAPARAIDSLSDIDLHRRFRKFRHRFTSGRDLAALLSLLRQMRRRRGRRSIERAASSPNIRSRACFSTAVRSLPRARRQHDR